MGRPGVAFLQMAVRVHRHMEHADDTYPTRDLRIEDHVLPVIKSVITGPNVLDPSPNVGHFSELKEATLQAKNVFVSLALPEFTNGVQIDFAQVPIGSSGKFKLCHCGSWTSFPQ
jgi:hypothetical protein